MQKKDVVNITGGVTTETGRELFGLDAEIYLRMKEKEDPEWERKVGEWCEDVLGQSLLDTRDLYVSLKSGIVLVEIINNIAPGTIRKYNKKEKMHVLMERENITLYLEACWKLGIANSDMFTVPDLHSRQNIAAVLNNLAALSSLAKVYGHCKVPSLRTNYDQVTPEEGSSAQPKPKKTWSVNAVTTPTYALELAGGEDLEYLLMDSNKKLNTANNRISVLENSNSELARDLKTTRNNYRTLQRQTQHLDFTQLPIDGTVAIPNGPTQLPLDVKQLQALVEAERMEKNRLLEEVIQLRAANNKYKADNKKLEATLLIQELGQVKKSLVKLLDKIFNMAIEVDENLVLHFEAYFKSSESIRHTFVSSLIQKLTGGTQVRIRSVSYNALARLIIFTLDSLHPSNGGDFIIGKYILQSSFAVYKKSGTLTYVWLHDQIKYHKFWGIKFFWEEYFWDRSSKHCPANLLAEPTLMQDWLTGELESFIVTMVGWGDLESVGIVEFFFAMLKRIDPASEATDELKAKISLLVEKQQGYKRSSSGFNLMNRFNGVNVVGAERPLQDLQNELQILKSSDQPIQNLGIDPKRDEEASDK